MAGLAIRIYGKPVTQGSMKRFPGGGITHSNKKLVPWRNLVGWEIKEAWGQEMTTAPVSINCLFKLERPRGHYGTGKNAFKLKPSAPQHHVVRPDGDKLLRAIKDALTGVVYKDDSQCYDSHVRKVWAESGESPGVVIIIETEPASE